MIIDKNWYSVNDTIVVFHNGEDEVNISFDWIYGLDIKILITKHIEDLYALPAMLLVLPFKEKSKEYETIVEAKADDTKIFTYDEKGLNLDLALEEHEDFIIKRRCRELFELRDNIKKEPGKYVFLDCEPEYLNSLDETIRWGMLLRAKELWLMNGEGEMLYEGELEENNEEIISIVEEHVKDKYIIGLKTVDSYCQLSNYLEEFNYKLNVRSPIHRLDKILASFLSKEAGYRSLRKYFGDIAYIEELYKSLFESTDHELIERLKKYFGGNYGK
jgi:hypothetical protein